MMKQVCATVVFTVLFTLSGPARAGDGSLPGDSLYQIDSKWVTQDGKELELKDLRGKKTIMTMVYLSCQYTCPTIISEVKSLESKLKKGVAADTRVLVVSFDPSKDTPKVMNAYAKKRKLDPQHWLFVTNKDESKIRELAAALGFKYKKSDNGEYVHSYMIVVLDEDGVVRARVEGANKDKAALIEALHGPIAAAEKSK